MQHMTFLTFIPFIAFIFYCILLVILIGSRKIKIARHYIAYIIAMIIWSLGSFIMKTDFPPSTLFWNQILMVGLVSMPVLFYHFTLILTGITKQKLILYLGYIAVGLLMIANFSRLIMKDAYMENREFKYELGPVAPIMAIWSLCYLILAFVNIIIKVKSNEIPLKRVKLILTGLVLVIIGGLLNFDPRIGKYPIDIVLNTINAVFIVYSIYHNKFLEIKLFVKKGIAYSLYTLILTSIYIATIFGVQQLLSTIIGYDGMWTTLIVAVLLALMFQPIKDVIQHGIDKLFYREILSHQLMLKSFSKIINNSLDLAEIIQSLTGSVYKTLQPKRITLFLKEEDHQYCKYSDKRDEHSKPYQYDENHPILNWFKQGHTILTKSDISSSQFFSGLWGMEKIQLKEMEMEFIVPILYRGEISGLLFLSEKKAGENYSIDEIDFIGTLLNHAAAVIDNARMYETVKQQAITDGLTRLHNHRYFHEVLGKMVNKRMYSTFSIAMIDVDLFKFYNDLYGHSAGDKALLKIAQVLKANVRKEDIVVRYGGEEFAIILPNIVGNTAFKVMNKIRKEVENCFHTSNEFSEFVTISAGFASFPEDGKTGEDVLERADQAMYAAKNSGRNKVISYEFTQKETVNQSQHDDIEQMQESIKSAYLSSIYALAATIDAKDRYTYGHSENVSNLAVALGRASGFTEDRLEVTKIAGMLHDVGKIGIPEAILIKPSKLTKAEEKVMKKHVDISITIIKHVPNLVNVIPAIMSHHERYDGEGYPRGIKGENIPIEGRCLCIVDAFDAMITDRPYRDALSTVEAIEELRKHSGTQFDPKLTKTFINMINQGLLDDILIVNRK